MQHWMAREPWLERLALDLSSAWWNDWRFWRGALVGAFAATVVLIVTVAIVIDANAAVIVFDLIH